MPLLGVSHTVVAGAFFLTKMFQYKKGDKAMFKDTRCQFFRRCNLNRECGGCRNPIERMMYEDTFPLKVQYSADMMGINPMGSRSLQNQVEADDGSL